MPFLLHFLFQLEILLFVRLKLIIDEVDDLKHLAHGLNVIILEAFRLDDSGDTATHHQTGLVDISGYIGFHLLQGVE